MEEKICDLCRLSEGCGDAGKSYVVIVCPRFEKRPGGRGHGTTSPGHDGAAVPGGAATLALALVLAVALVVGAARAGLAAETLRVAAASSMTAPLGELARAFEEETGSKVVLSFGSTGKLSFQISHGAPFDAFFAADTAHVEKLAAGGHLREASVVPYARGRVVIVVNDGSGAAVSGISGLAGPAIKRLAIANPDHAPYGRAAREALTSAGLWDGIREKVVYGENVRQALVFVQTGNAQAGLVAASVADVPGVYMVEVDPALYGPIEQAAAVTSRGSAPELAAGFISFAAGPRGRAVLERYGFLPVPDPSAGPED